jgi:hypothetical protein
MHNMSDFSAQSDHRLMEPLKVDQEAVKSLIEVTKMWANLTQFEQDLENYEKLKHQYE